VAKARAPSVVFLELVDRVLRGPGVTSQGERRAAFDGSDGAPWLETVRKHAYKMTDEAMTAERAKRSDDAIYELAIAAALGMSQRRRDAALAAIEDAEQQAEAKRAAR
jgi:hypothetical protein